MLVPLREILADAHAKGYAVGAFNCLSTEHLQGTMEAAEALRSPVILQVAEVQFPYAPLAYMIPAFLEAARRATVPVTVHLDHGQSFETCIRAIRLGCNSVMFDGAALPFEQNVAATTFVVRAAKAADVDVEAELGKVGLTTCEADVANDVCTDVEESARFIAQTGVDALAIAIGNLHGKYVATPRLNIARLKEIDARNRLPLVLHGGSGTSEEDFKSCIHNGISKINVATAMQLAATARVQAYLSETNSPNYIDLKQAIREAARESVEYHMRLFESNGRA